MTKERASAEGEGSARTTEGAESGPSGNLQEHWLGRSLRRMYDDALQEPMPDSLRDLLEELARRDKEEQKD